MQHPSDPYCIHLHLILTKFANEMTGSILLLLTLAASNASSSFSSVVQESIAAAATAAVEVGATLIVSKTRLSSESEVRREMFWSSAASLLFSFQCSVQL